MILGISIDRWCVMWVVGTAIAIVALVIVRRRR